MSSDESNIFGSYVARSASTELCELGLTNLCKHKITCLGVHSLMNHIKW